MTGMKLERILVVDDESMVRGVVTDLLKELGYNALGVSSISQARRMMREDQFDLVLSDMRLEDGNGLEFLDEVRREFPQMQRVIMTGFGTLDSAVEAIRLGVFDYLIKPVDASRLEVTLGRMEQWVKLQAENTYLRRELADADHDGIQWGQCPAMENIRRMIERIARTDATVMIQGESGTGKEVVARVLHLGSARADQPFIKVNCAAIPATLLESEFFGHEKGAFTGAVQRREGRFELANHGTLLLDEISEIPPDLQVKLLRVLQEREFERVGGNKTIQVDVRVIATTNRRLNEEVEKGRFREDLFYRLNVVPLILPPLRERGDDVVELAKVFAAEFGRKHGKKIPTFTTAVSARLTSYPWPGNVRELQNVVERAVILSGDEGVWKEEDFPEVAAEKVGAPGETSADADFSLARMEQRLILRALSHCGGNRTRAAKLLGVSLRTIRNKINEYRSAGVEV